MKENFLIFSRKFSFAGNPTQADSSSLALIMILELSLFEDEKSLIFWTELDYFITAKNECFFLKYFVEIMFVPNWVFIPGIKLGSVEMYNPRGKQTLGPKTMEGYSSYS